MSALKPHCDPSQIANMPNLLHYGSHASVAVVDAPAGSWRIADVPRGEPLIDAQAGTRAALRAPRDFPPLRQAVVPGDHVALALEPHVPEACAVVAGVVHELVEIGVEPDNITIVCTLDEPVDPRHRLPAMLRGRVQLERHDPANHERIAFLSANRKGRPVYLNRLLCDADLLITVGLVRHATSHHDLGLYAGLYPTFSDADTQTRFRNPMLIDATSPIPERARNEVAKIGWLAGAVFTVQVVPAGPDALMNVLAGDPAVVDRDSQHCYTEVWSYEARESVDLVVAAISGGEAQQTWDNLTRALITAEQAVSETGAIVLCSELITKPGPGVERVRADVQLDKLFRRMNQDRPVDGLTALALAGLLDRTRVYLLSGLEAEVVERVGVAPLSEPNDVARLIKRSKSCLLLPHAQFAVVSRHAEDAT